MRWHGIEISLSHAIVSFFPAKKKIARITLTDRASLPYFHSSLLYKSWHFANFRKTKTVFLIISIYLCTAFSVSLQKQSISKQEGLIEA